MCCRRPVLIAVDFVIHWYLYMAHGTLNLLTVQITHIFAQLTAFYHNFRNRFGKFKVRKNEIRYTVRPLSTCSRVSCTLTYYDVDPTE